METIVVSKKTAVNKVIDIVRDDVNEAAEVIKAAGLHTIERVRLTDGLSHIERSSGATRSP